MAGDMKLITFPWPPKEISPNARVHWAVKSKLTKGFKNDCLNCAVQYKKELKAQSKFKIVFCPPDKRKRDADNLIASFKAGFDALSVVAGIDDSKFEWTYVRGEPVKHGAVIVEVLK
jgi:crossover junction endodeoxyribonuclease RusA